MAMMQLAERKNSPVFIVGKAGKSKFQDDFLKLMNESKGMITLLPGMVNFSDKENEFTVPHKDNQWDLYRKIYENIGVVSNAVDNTANFAIQSGYELEGSDENKTKVQKWIEDNNFNSVLLNIMKQMQVFGNAYLEISDEIKLLPVENMYVVVRKGDKNDGEIIGYKQMLNTRKAIDFNVDEVVHFKWKELGPSFYGTSDLKSSVGILTKLLNLEEDVGEILHRYAHPIIHYKLGTDEVPATQAQLDDFVSLKNNLRVGEDLVTSSNVDHQIISADMRMIQIDGLVKHMENQLIAGLQVPEIFVRGGETSNKATSDTELQAFDRKVKALRQIVGELVHDEIFVKHINADVEISWNEMSVESEEMKSNMLMNLVNGGVPTNVALMMTGWGSWVDDYEKSKKEQQEQMQQQMQQQNTTFPGGKPQQPEPKENDFDNQEDFVIAWNKWKTNINESLER